MQRYLLQVFNNFYTFRTTQKQQTWILHPTTGRLDYDLV